MFKKMKCPKCDLKVSKKFDFCPFCGLNFINSNKEDYGLLGKNDFDELDLGLPRGLNMLFKPLMKELTKQMALLDREIKKEMENNPNKQAKTSFSISFGTPQGRPIKIENFSNNSNKSVSPITKKILRLPKFSPEHMVKLKKLSKIEPETNLRRLSDRIVYELSLPGVDYLNNVNISNFENFVEVKAFSDDKLFVKNIEVDLPLVNYTFEKDLLVLEFSLR